MTFAYCAQVQCLRLASRLLPRGPAGNDSDSDSDSDTFASANVMLDASDYEHDYTPPRQRTGVDSNRSSSDDTESVLAGDEGLIDIRDETEFKHVQQRETDIDVLLEEYRASLRESCSALSHRRGDPECNGPS